MPFSWGRRGAIAVALVCGWLRLAGAQLLPSSDEFRVNANTTGGQVSASIAATPSGEFIVSWSDSAIDGDFFGVAMRRFSAPAVPLAPEVRVNSYTTDDQERSSVAVGANGDFVVVWDSYYQDGSYTGIYAQRFNSAGAPLGTEFQVNSNTTFYQVIPIVAAVPNGFVIAWADDIDSSDGHLMARRYDSNGVALGTEFQVNQFSSSNKSPGEIIPVDQGFVVTWSMGFDQDGDAGGIFARRFDDNSVAQGTEFVVNTYTTGFQGSPQGAASADGSFVIVWSGYGGGDTPRGVFGQRFDSSGAPAGTEFRVNTYTTGPQTRPNVGVHPGGDFVVTWQSNSQDGSGYGIFARAFKADGTPETPEILVNQFTSDHQASPDIDTLSDRDVVIVWQSINQDGSFAGLYGRSFRRAGDRISGKKLSMKTSAASPSRNGLTFVSKDAALEMPQATPEDPRCPPAGSGSLSSGARLRVVGTGGDFTIDLPCVNWTANAAGTRYQYRDGRGATCQAIVLIAGRLMKAVCKGSQVAYSLGSVQGDVHVTLSTGDPATNRKYCASFGPQSSATVVRDGSDGRSYRAVQADTGVCP